MNHLPNTPFPQSRPARIAQARQRFFEEGQAPTGVVDEAVFESWARCLRLLGNPRERAEFQPVTASRTHLALMKNRHLRQAWMDELPRLETVLSATSCAAMLTDATGVLIGASCVGRSHEELMPVATRLGVNLSEDAVGTTAPGVAARTGKPVCVLGGEHFFDSVQEMHCAAAPIRDIQGRLAGVLDLSSERIPFAFDAAAVVGLYAGAIENRLLVAQSTEHLVIRIQVAPELLDSAMVGLIGVSIGGVLAWENGVAKSLLGAGGPGRLAVGQEPDSIGERVEGFAWQRLAALPSTGAAPLTLPNGLQVWARAEMRAPDGRRGVMAVAAAPSDVTTRTAANEAAQVPANPGETAPDRQASAPPQTMAEANWQSACPSSTDRPAATQRLRDSDLLLIQQTLQACGGNVSDAAARLGVSRGLIYRRLRAAERRGAPPTA